MAIVIPSSKTYDRQNPKVRDNVIERIEVGAVEVVPDNEYETSVYNEKFLVPSDLVKDTPISNSDTDGSYWGGSGGGFSATRISGSYVGYLKQKTTSINVKIPIVEKNKYINYLFTKVDKDGNPNIKYSLFGIKKAGKATAQWGYNVVSTVAQIIEGDISYSPPTSVSAEQNLEFPQEISISENSDNAGQVASSAKQSLIPWGNIKTAEATNKTNYYEINLDIMCGLTTVKMTSYSFTNGTSDTYVPPTQLSFSGDYETYEPTALDITIYGNTIGIDLNDNTVYINGETAKKVHSIDGNELMQTSNIRFFEKKWEMEQGKDYTIYTEGYGDNIQPMSATPFANVELKNTITFITQDAIDAEKTLTYLINGISYTTKLRGGTESYTINGLVVQIEISAVKQEKKLALQYDYSKTQKNYKSGKETATIRCSISDYYDGDQKIIAIDNSTRKMSFDIGDQVVPMVYGADGKDYPMSTKKDGSPKVFSVLGVKKYYDGAVWQELSLQEV